MVAGQSLPGESVKPELDDLLETVIDGQIASEFLIQLQLPHPTTKEEQEALEKRRDGIVCELEDAIECYRIDSSPVNEAARKLFKKIQKSADDFVNAIDAMGSDAELVLLTVSKGKGLMSLTTIRNQVAWLSEVIPRAENQFTRQRSSPRKVPSKVLAGKAVKLFYDHYEGRRAGSGAKLAERRGRFVELVFEAAGIKVPDPQTLDRQYIKDPWRECKHGGQA